MHTVTVSIELDSYDGDSAAEFDNGEMLRNTLVTVAQAFAEFYPGNSFVTSDVSKLFDREFPTEI